MPTEIIAAIIGAVAIIVAAIISVIATKKKHTHSKLSEGRTDGKTSFSSPIVNNSSVENMLNPDDYQKVKEKIMTDMSLMIINRPTNLRLLLEMLRDQCDERMYDMANKLSISSSDLSAIESGIRKAPEGFVMTLSVKYDLTESMCIALNKAIISDMESGDNFSEILSKAVGKASYVSDKNKVGRDYDE